MSRTASKLRQQQISLARRLTSAELGRTHMDPLDLIRDAILLAGVTLELDAALRFGRPFPTAWVLPESIRRRTEPHSDAS